jgi:hypothetical protein
MPVPNTTTFSLQDVVTEIGTGSSLINCFSNAKVTGFDPLYGSSTDTDLYAFRNYDHSVEVPFAQELGFNAISSTNACSATPSTYWTNEGTTFLSSTDIWDDELGTSHADAGFYSNGAKYREWNGAAWVSSGLCGGGA